MYINISELMRLKGRLNDINHDLNVTLGNVNQELESVCNNINSSELKEANLTVKNNISNLSVEINTNINNLSEFMASQLGSYKVSADEAQAALKNLVNIVSSVFTSGGIINMEGLQNLNNPTGTTGSTTTDPTPTPTPTPTVDVSIYHENPDKGFVITTDNPKYEPTDQERQILYNLVASESANTYDDALGVASTVFNRVDTNYNNNYKGTGSAIWAQLSAPNQYGVYYKGYVAPWVTPEKYTMAERAVNDALAGVRNCSYTNYRSSNSYGYSSNQISPNGNRFGYR